jgi:amino acid transporter
MDAMAGGSFIRVIRRKEVLALAFGAIIGWSWVVLTGVWVEGAGSLGAVIGFLVGGLAVVLVGFTYAELAAAMPQVGGEHVYSLRALGRTASFVCTWAILLGYVSVVAFEAVALPTVAEYLAINTLPIAPSSGGEVQRQRSESPLFPLLSVRA